MTGSSRNARTGAIVFPSGNPRSAPDPEGQWYPQFAQDDMSEFIPSSGAPGSPTKIWRPTPSSGGDIYPTWPCTIMLMDTELSLQMIGELDDVRWFPAAIGPVVAKDTLINDTHTAFQNGNRSEPWALFLMRTRA